MSMADELKKLADLKEQGLLSEAEYDAEKSKLLSGGSSGPQPAASGAAPAPQFVPKPNSYMVHAIIATLFCFLPTGIIAIMKASQVNGAHAAGRYADAQKLASEAQLWVNISVVLAFVFGGVWAAIGGSL